MSVTLFNRGKRTIVGAHPGKFEKSKLDKHGKPMPLKFTFEPERAMTFDDETAAKLQRLYAGEVLSVKDAQKQFEVAVEDAAEKEPEPKDVAKKPEKKAAG